MTRACLVADPNRWVDTSPLWQQWMEKPVLVLVLVPVLVLVLVLVLVPSGQTPLTTSQPKAQPKICGLNVYIDS